MQRLIRVGIVSDLLTSAGVVILNMSEDLVAAPRQIELQR